MLLDSGGSQGHEVYWGNIQYPGVEMMVIYVQA